MSAMGTLYSPLPSSHHIRILKLEKTKSGHVTATLQAADLETQPEYTCLSYTWGPPRWEDDGEKWAAPSHSFPVNGHSFAIRLNLRNALNHLYEVLCGRPIWIDAICINQKDMPERNTQVALMNRIYREARDVIVWLGEATPAWEAAIRNMDHFTLTLGEYWGAFAHAEKTWKDAFVACELTNDEHVQIIHFLTGSRWSSRMWTMQEHVLARQMQFLCGNIIVPMETMWKGSKIATLAGVTTAWADLDVQPPISTISYISPH